MSVDVWYDFENEGQDKKKLTLKGRSENGCRFIDSQKSCQGTRFLELVLMNAIDLN